MKVTTRFDMKQQDKKPYSIKYSDEEKELILKRAHKAGIMMIRHGKLVPNFNAYVRMKSLS